MAERSSSSSSSSGIGVTGLLGCIFVTLKLLGKITWSWWWVTAPFWGGLAIVLAVLIIFGVGAGGVFGFLALLDWRKRRKFKRTLDEARSELAAAEERAFRKRLGLKDEVPASYTVNRGTDANR